MIGKQRKGFRKINWFYRINSLFQCKILINFFDKLEFTFFTKKYNCYRKIPYDKIEYGKHLDKVKRQKLITFSKSINLYLE
jgi:hypothetical protein